MQCMAICLIGEPHHNGSLYVSRADSFSRHRRPMILHLPLVSMYVVLYMKTGDCLPQYWLLVHTSMLNDLFLNEEFQHTQSCHLQAVRDESWLLKILHKKMHLHEDSWRKYGSTAFSPRLLCFTKKRD